MTRDPFVAFASPGRMHLSLRTLAANDNVPLAATAPPRHADGGASTRWPLLARRDALEFGASAANEFKERPVRKVRAWL
jgi:hypothetical protein